MVVNCFLELVGILLIYQSKPFPGLKKEGIKPMDDPGFTEEGENWVNSYERLSTREHSAST